MDLIPLASWTLLGGKCRQCSAPIGLFYPAVEFAALGVAIWTIWVVPGPLVWISVVFGWVLLVLAWTDWREFILPDMLTLPLIPLGLLVIWVVNAHLVPTHLIATILGGAGFVLIGLLYRRIRQREGLGLGDAKLMAVAGAWLGLEGLLSTMLVGSVLGICFAGLCHLSGKSLQQNDKIPFGTFLCWAIWLTWLYGPISLNM